MSKPTEKESAAYQIFDRAFGLNLPDTGAEDKVRLTAEVTKELGVEPREVEKLFLEWCKRRKLTATPFGDSADYTITRSN